MKKDHTDITIVLDRSGSMATVARDTIGGFNRFLDDQKAVSGTADITLHQFDDQFDIVLDTADIKSAEHLTDKTFVPRGNTALLDAIGRAINQTGNRLELTPERAKAAKVVFVIITDGKENASKEYDKDKVFEMIKHQTDKYQWQFVFLGANQDAIAAAAGIGICAANAMKYAHNAVGTQALFCSTSDNLRSFRTGASADMAYSDEDRKKQEKAGA